MFRGYALTKVDTCQKRTNPYMKGLLKIVASQCFLSVSLTPTVPRGWKKIEKDSCEDEGPSFLRGHHPPLGESLFAHRWTYSSLGSESPNGYVSKWGCGPKNLDSGLP